MTERKARKPRASKTPKPLPPTGIAEIDALMGSEDVSIHDYIRSVSAYVLKNSTIEGTPRQVAKTKKAAQIRLSNALAIALRNEFRAKIPEPKESETHVGEFKVSGALRSGNSDVTETHHLDGLRVAIELKPVNLAVGRAIWNRFGDLRTFAVNIHLKFPFCIVGGVLVIPTWEETGTTAAKKAEMTEEVIEEEGIETLAEEASAVDESDVTLSSTLELRKKDTKPLINRAVARLMRAGGRKTEGDAAHLLEGIAVVVYDPETGQLDPDLPPKGSRLRWDEFIEDLVAAYKGRFED
jgi:hypothetical protein